METAKNMAQASWGSSSSVKDLGLRVSHLAFHRPCTLQGAAGPGRAGRRGMSMARELEPHQGEPAVCQPREENAGVTAEKSTVCPTCPKRPRHGVMGCGRFNIDAKKTCLMVRPLKQQKVWAWRGCEVSLIKRNISKNWSGVTEMGICMCRDTRMG